MKKLIIALGCAALLSTPLSALTIKLGSLAPVGSPWDISLKKMSAQWEKQSGGSVVVKIYPGGIVGDEDDMIRKMRIGQLDAAGITGVGLSRIFSGALAMQLPLLIRNNEELLYVLDKMKPFFEKKIEEKGFKVLCWTLAGWVNYFSKKPVVGPDDLRPQKLWVWAGDEDQILAWKECGFHTVPLPATEIMTALQSGMVEAFPTTPLTAAACQWFGLAPHMNGMKWAPFIGAVIVTSKTWAKIPADLKPQLLDTVRRIGTASEAEALKADEAAIETMKKHGLIVHPVSAAVEQQWRDFVEIGFKKLIGKSFDRESYDLTKRYLDEYRKSRSK